MTIVAQPPSDSEQAFEARCDKRLNVWLQSHQHRIWICSDCGEQYDARHIYYGYTCDECGADLEVVSATKTEAKL